MDSDLVFECRRNVESVFDNPFLSAEWAILRRAFLCPFEYAVEMEVMQTLSLDWYAVIPRYFATWTGRLEGELAYSAALLTLNIPLPSRHCVPGVYLHLHYYNSNYYQKFNV